MITVTHYAYNAKKRIESATKTQTKISFFIPLLFLFVILSQWCYIFIAAIHLDIAAIFVIAVIVGHGAWI